MHKTQKYDIVVSGGGMAGLSFAIACAMQNFTVLVVDKDNCDNILNLKYDGRASAVARASYNLFNQLGLHDLLKDHLSPIWDIRVLEGHPITGTYPFFLHYNHQDAGKNPFGYIIENIAIRQALYKRQGELDNLTILQNAEITDFQAQPDCQKITLNTGDMVMAQLLVGAEGKFSNIREMANIRCGIKDFKQTSIVCTVQHENNHQGVAVELFLPSGPFAMLPMTNKRSNIVWTEKAPLARNFLALSDDDFMDALNLRFGDWLGPLSQIGPRFSYPLELRHAETYIKSRFALIGDSAHSIHPVAGQGLNLGLRDVAALVESLNDVRKSGGDIGSDAALQHYQRWRYFDNQLMAHVCSATVGLFSNSNDFLKIFRNGGMTALNAFPPLKKIFMNHAMGFMGDLPKLLQDRPL